MIKIQLVDPSYQLVILVHFTKFVLQKCA